MVLYGEEEGLLRSTSATRLNAFLGLPAVPSPRCSLPEDIDLYGLTPYAIKGEETLSRDLEGISTCLQP